MSERRKTSDNGVKKIIAEEGLVLYAYPDPGAVEAAKKNGWPKPGDPEYGHPWTIGYGHTGGVQSGDTITKAEAEELLKKDLEGAERTVESLVTADINQNQFDALVSFVYNCGPTAFKKSTLLKKINEKDYTGAADEFPKWKHSKGVVMDILVRRRKRERDLFEAPVSYSSYSPGGSSIWTPPGSYSSYSSGSYSSYSTGGSSIWTPPGSYSSHSPSPAFSRMLYSPANLYAISMAPGSYSSSGSVQRELSSNTMLSREPSGWTGPTWSESPGASFPRMSSRSWMDHVSVTGPANAPGISVSIPIPCSLM